jgi:hypothetical protein
MSHFDFHTSVELDRKNISIHNIYDDNVEY